MVKVNEPIEIEDYVEDIMYVEIFSTGPWSLCYLYVSIKLPNSENIVKVNDEFVNERAMSAVLTAELGFINAVNLLEKHNIPRTRPLWDLNHSDLWEPNQ